jgi:hypothetical protein
MKIGAPIFKLYIIGLLAITLISIPYGLYRYSIFSKVFANEPICKLYPMNMYMVTLIGAVSSFDMLLIKISMGKILLILLGLPEMIDVELLKAGITLDTDYLMRLSKDS